jgi:hypothetical protein
MPNTVPTANNNDTDDKSKLSFWQKTNHVYWSWEIQIFPPNHTLHCGNKALRLPSNAEIYKQ